MTIPSSEYRAHVVFKALNSLIIDFIESITYVGYNPIYINIHPVIC